MKKYNWNVNSLKNDLNILLKMYNQAHNDEYRQKIKEYIKEAQVYIEEEQCLLPDDTLFFESLESVVPLYLPYYEYLETFYKCNYSLIKSEPEIVHFPQIKLTLDEQIGLINEFYKKMGKDFYCAFQKNYLNRFKNIRKIDLLSDELKGFTFFIGGLNKPYITIGENLTCQESLITLLHEETHATAAIMNSERYSLDSNLLWHEIETNFTTLVGCDLFSKWLGDNSYENLKSNYFLRRIIYTSEILEEKILYDRYKQLNPNDSDIKVLDLNLSSYSFEGTSTTEKMMPYIFSYLVAIELYTIYEQDPKEALNLLKRIILADPKEDELKYIINSCKIAPNKSVDTFVKKMSLKKS